MKLRKCSAKAWTTAAPARAVMKAALAGKVVIAAAVATGIAAIVLPGKVAGTVKAAGTEIAEDRVKTAATGVAPTAGTVKAVMAVETAGVAAAEIATVIAITAKTASRWSTLVHCPRRSWATR